MRLIKFRAISKLTPNKERTFEFTLEQLMRGQVSISYPEHWHFLEFTGLLDKNGKEIYEGDIVKTDYDCHQKPYIVKFGEFSITQYYDNNDSISPNNDEVSILGFYIETPDDEDFNTSLHQQDVEVIGNIYSNPELLN